MKILENETLAKYTTFKMGGVAKKLYFPENLEELKRLVISCKPLYIIGAGSNLLINDDKEFAEVINLRDLDLDIKNYGDGNFYAGASVRLQKLIQYINSLGFGGIEYLFSVPGSVGGAIVMNAGRGNRVDLISKYVTKVRALVDGEVVEFTNEECHFGHRSSVFKNSSIVVLGAYFKFVSGDTNEFEKLRKQRIAYSKEKQDTESPNFGTCFRVSNPYIMKFVRLINKKKKSGVHFSGKTTNWLLNENGRFCEAITEINKVKKIHQLFGKDCEAEVIIWE